MNRFYYEKVKEGDSQDNADDPKQVRRCTLGMLKWRPQKCIQDRGRINSK
jgi:hypothetical protein